MSQTNVASPSVNKNGRIIAIGDIHGCSRELKALIEKFQPQKNDTVVFLGDYVDRGADSRGVIDTIIALGKICKTVCLKGNHEAMFIDFLDRPESSGAALFILNGGATTLANYASADGSINIPDEHVAFLRSLQLTYQTDEYFFVHAGVPEQPLSTIDLERDAMELMWTRYPFLGSDYAWEKLVIHGHTPVREPEVLANRVNCDTGCVYDGKLTAFVLPEKEFHHVARLPVTPETSPSYLEDIGRVSTRFSGRIPILVRRPGEEFHPFETLNYNQFGILMKDANPIYEDYFSVGDFIEGEIGNDGSKMHFNGEVVRTDHRAGMMVYALKIAAHAETVEALAALTPADTTKLMPAYIDEDSGDQ